MLTPPPNRRHALANLWQNRLRDELLGSELTTLIRLASLISTAWICCPSRTRIISQTQRATKPFVRKVFVIYANKIGTNFTLSINWNTAELWRIIDKIGYPRWFV
jgi:hypothetical protein